jgi:glycosyltransferase involved in cell wall biosynthesis
MRRLLFILDSLEYSGATTQVYLLAAGLPRDHFAVQVCALSKEGPVASKLRSAGIAVHALGNTRLVNLAAVWRLRRLVQEVQPNAIHTWGPSSVRIVSLALDGSACQVLASAPFSPQKKKAALGPLYRWLLRKVDRFIAFGPAMAETYRRLGLPPGKIRIVPPGVEAACNGLGSIAHGQMMAPGIRWIVCAGPLEAHKGHRDAIWAFDVLQFLYDDVRLLLVGSGSCRERLERFAAATGSGLRVQFSEPTPDLGQVLARAEVVWVPSLAEGGIHVALEAMAHGRAVVASRLPGLAEIIEDAETGLLVEPGNKVELARQTRWLLDEPDRRRQIGEAARHRVASHFSAADLVRRYADLYGMKAAA